MYSPGQIEITQRAQLQGHAAAVFALSRGPEYRYFYSGAGDGIIAAWDLENPGSAQAFARMQGNIFSLALSGNDEVLLAGSMQGQIAVFDRKNSGLRYTIDRPGKSVFSLCVIPGETTWIAGCQDGTLLVGSTDSSEHLQNIPVAASSLRALALSQDGGKLAIASSDHRIYILDMAEMQVTRVLTGHTNSVFSLHWLHQDQILLSGSRDATLRVWDMTTIAAHGSEIAAHMFTINDIAVHPEGTLFATAGRDKHIKIWDAQNFSLLRVIDKEKYAGHINSVNKLFWSRWNNCLISCGDDRSILVWDIGIH
ncbi:MAG: WD40 repeat domain-containing protein [Chitinophagales bacterium]